MHFNKKSQGLLENVMFFRNYTYIYVLVFNPNAKLNVANFSQSPSHKVTYVYIYILIIN